MRLDRSTTTARLAAALAVLTLTLALILLHAAGSEESGLSPELEMLRPFLGSWNGALDAEPNHVWTQRSWVPMLKGQAIRDIREVPEADFEAETIYYFDREKSIASFIDITDNGYVTRGEIVSENGEWVFTGNQVMPDGTTRATRTTRTFQPDGTMIERFWSLEQGAWQAGHSIIYTPVAEDQG